MPWADKCFGKTLIWLKLSNSGDTLKHMVPSHGRKAMSGWSNYPGTVTSYMMNENEMGYRGSKSNIINVSLFHLVMIILLIITLFIVFVKEQRVDGSCCTIELGAQISSIVQLRCTLMGFERNYQIKIPSKQLINRPSSSSSIQSNINPWFITGFSDAESSFVISIYPDSNSKLKWRVTASFSIHIHIKDIELLEQIQNTLGVGKVRKNSKTTAILRVDNIKELQTIIDHFNNYPLITAKSSDFLLFEECFNLIKQKQHLTPEGFEQILALKYNLNKGLPEELKLAFPNVVAVPRPVFEFNGIPDPFWVSGFVSGDSSFSVSIEKSTSKLGKRVRLIFGTCLHIRDKELLVGMAKFFNDMVPIGKESQVHSSESKSIALLQIKNNFDIENKVIPFFNKYPILGVKSLDFADFKEVAELVKNKEHLTADGLSKITKIVDGMNLDRNLENSVVSGLGTGES